MALKHEPENVLVWKPSFFGRTSCVWETNMALRRISGPEGRNSRIVKKKLHNNENRILYSFALIKLNGVANNEDKR